MTTDRLDFHLCKVISHARHRWRNYGDGSHFHDWIIARGWRIERARTAKLRKTLTLYEAHAPAEVVDKVETLMEAGETDAERIEREKWEAAEILAEGLYGRGG